MAAGAGCTTSSNASSQAWEILSQEGSPGKPEESSRTPSPGWDILSASSSPSPTGVVALEETQTEAEVARNLFYSGYGAAEPARPASRPAPRASPLRRR